MKIYGIMGDNEVKRLVSSILIGIMILAVGCSNTKTLTVKDYLQSNNSAINIKDINDFDGLELIKEDLKDKKIIFTGEYHALTKDDEVRMKMVKYIQQEIGLNSYLLECGYSSAYFMNKYLESGDEEILKKVFSNVEGTSAHNIDDYNFFKDLYEFNKTLSEEDKIKVVGIDIEHNFGNTYDYIKTIIKDKSLNTQVLEKVLTSLEDMNSCLKTSVQVSQDEKIKLFNNLNSDIDVLIEDIKNNKQIYINIFKEDFFGLELVVKNIKAKYLSDTTYYDAEKCLSIREEQMYENFVIQDKEIDNGIYFGQFGANHINKSPIRIANVQSEIETTYVDFEPIASKLNNSDKYQGKVMSILYAYQDKYKSEEISYLDKEIFGDYLESENECILFDFGNLKSPFKAELISPFTENGPYEKNKAITDYIDGMFIIKGIISSANLSIK